MRTYSELIEIPSYEERLEYLLLRGLVGDITFGGSRLLNQSFYRSREWKKIRRDVILRDNGCDLSHPDYQIVGKLIVHHIEPLTIDDVRLNSQKIYDMENLVCTSLISHNAIHYGDASLAQATQFVERRPNDTCPWKGGNE